LVNLSSYSLGRGVVPIVFWGNEELPRARERCLYRDS
jgi:hypothetical protein